MKQSGSSVERLGRRRIDFWTSLSIESTMETLTSKVGIGGRERERERRCVMLPLFMVYLCLCNMLPNCT